MIPVVFDCNVILAAIGWRGTGRLCLKLAAQRHISLHVTTAILDEYETVIPERLKEEIPELDPGPKLAWIRSRSKLIEPAPLGKQRSRDHDDDPYLACALGAGARYLVTYDQDLLSLGKPFGIEIIRPAELLRRINQGLRQKPSRKPT
jgi:putative PIN family toxin of toxin-antitoxin system